MLLFHFEAADPKYGPTTLATKTSIQSLLVERKKIQRRKKSAFTNNFLPVAEKKINFLSLIAGIVWLEIKTLMVDGIVLSTWCELRDSKCEALLFRICFYIEHRFLGAAVIDPGKKS